VYLRKYITDANANNLTISWHRKC